MNAEFFAAIEDIEKEKGIPRDYMYDKIRQAMLAAFRRDNPENEDNVEVILDDRKERRRVLVTRIVFILPCNIILFHYFLHFFLSGFYFILTAFFFPLLISIIVEMYNSARFNSHIGTFQDFIDC